MKRVGVILTVLISICFTSVSEAVFLNPAKDTPLNLVFNLSPGEEKNFSMLVSNPDNAISDIEVSIVDGFQNPAGSISYRLATQTQSGIGAWTTPQIQHITLKAFENKTLNFKISIPANALPGTYSAGVSTIASDKATAESDKNVGGQVLVRNIKAMAINIAGEVINQIHIASLMLTHEKDNHKLQLHLINKGNTIVKTDVRIMLTNTWLHTTREITKNDITVLPGTESRSDIYIPKEFIGNYQADINIKHAQFNPLGKKYTPLSEKTISMKFTQIPWTIINNFLLAIISLLVCIGGILIFRIIRRNRLRTYVVQNNESLEMIAKKFNIHWEKIVKLNHLKAPYSITNEQKLLLPIKKKN